MDPAIATDTVSTTAAAGSTTGGTAPATMLSMSRDELSALLKEAATEAVSAERQREQASADAEKQSLALALANSRQARKQTMINDGRTPAQAEIAVTEADARALGQGNTVISQPNTRHTFKAEDIGEFDGNPLKLHGWIQRVEALHDSKPTKEWQDPIITVLPLCLKGAAAHWYAQLSIVARAKLTTWSGWKEGLKTFEPDTTEIRQIADARTWKVRQELVQTYFYDKLSLLRTAYTARSDIDYVLGIKLGLPASLQLAVRANLALNPTLDALLTELRQLEGPWRAESPATRSLIGESSRVSTSSSSNTRSSSSSPTARSSGRRPPLSTTYDKKNVWNDASGDRHYRIPGTNEKLSLGKDRCKHCGGKHFDFEHHHLQVKKEVKYVEGYAVSPCYDIIDDESLTEDDEDFDMLDYDPSEANTSANSSTDSVYAAQATANASSNRGASGSSKSPTVSPSPKPGKGRAASA